jgi:hypothetical protein
MIANEQEYIKSVASKYGVAPHRLMDALKIRYAGNKYYVKNKEFLSYPDAVREAESSLEIDQTRNTLKQSDIENMIEQTRSPSLKSYWSGEASLLSAYWGLGVGVNAIFLAIYLLLNRGQFAYLLLIVWIPYMVFAYVSIWQCADNTEWKVWGYMARGVVIMGFLRLFQVITNL